MSEQIAYVILETEKDDEGYIPCIVQEGEGGYWTTSWRWGHNIDVAKAQAKKINAQMGLGDEDVAKLVLQSMALQDS